MTKDLTKWLAFTLAEVLITIAIIGVVAILTIPTLLTNVTDRQFDTASTTFQRKFGEALRVMNTQGILGGYTGTEATEKFVDELSKHIKILKTCDNTHLTDCFTEKVTFGGETVEIKDIKKSSNLGKEWSTDTNVIGIQFANGVNALLAYNPSCTGNPYDNDYIKVNGNASSAKSANVTISVSDCLAILYDVNANAKPNTDLVQDKAKDLRNVNVTALGKVQPCKGKATGEVCVIAFAPEPLNCQTDPDAAKYCGRNAGTTDYWAGAQKACAEAGGSLPDADQLATIANEVYNLSPGTIGAIDNKHSGLNNFTNNKYGIVENITLLSSVDEGTGKMCGRNFSSSNTDFYAIEKHWDNHYGSVIYAVCVGGLKESTTVTYCNPNAMQEIE